MKEVDKRIMLDGQPVPDILLTFQEAKAVLLVLPGVSLKSWQINDQLECFDMT